METVKSNYKIIVSISLLVFWIGLSDAQEFKQVFTTSNNQTGIITAKITAIKDNRFEINYDLKWVDKNMVTIKKQKEDIFIFLDPKDFYQSEIKYLRCLTEIKAKVPFFAEGKPTILVFEVKDSIRAGDIKIRSKFKYASISDFAKNGLQDFTLKQPNELTINYKIDYSNVLDKTPPYLSVIEPPVNKSFKPVVKDTILRLLIKAVDFRGIKVVKVNDLDAKQLNDSMYQSILKLIPGGENAIELKAFDNSGLSARENFTILCQSAIIADNKDNNYEKVLISDIDENIPVVNSKNPNRFALIIGNEDYSSFQKGLSVEVNVDFARRDADIFYQYAYKTLGIPEENIMLLKDAKAIEMHRGVEKLQKLAKNMAGKAELFFYFAGHGFPDELSKEPHILPVDVSGTDLKFALKLDDLYKKLTEYPSQRVTVFLDACFSGGARNKAIFAARSVIIKPKENVLKGNLVVFSASSESQSALPYMEKKHGLFTYFLLKKIQETQGKVTYKELNDYVSQEVAKKCILINNKEQNPKVNVSADIISKWGKFLLYEL
jgi:hypothetical protein